MTPELDGIEFVIFDTETTGLDPQSGDRVVELAAVRLKGNARTATFETFINPRRSISQAAFSVNRITAEMLQDAPEAGEVIPRFLEFIQGSCLCSYNAGFDLEFLDHELELIGRPALEDIAVIDILKMARRLLPGLERYALWFVAERLGVKNKQEHRALSDVKMTLEVFSKLRQTAQAKGITDFNNFSGIFGINPRIVENINNQKIAQIQEAIDLRVKLKIRYLSTSSAQVTEREVIPSEIRQERGHAYMIGYCCLRNEERSFRVDSILHLEIA